MLNNLSAGLAATLLGSLLLAAQTLAQTKPEPTQSQYFNTFGGGIALVPTSQSTTTSYAPRYVLILELRQNIPLGAVAVATFENPINPNQPISTAYTFTSNVFSTNEKRITLGSPSLNCVTNGRNYRTRVTLYADAKKSRVLGTHEQVVNFTVTPEQIQQLTAQNPGFRLPECRK
jgi:hypothetical protein